MGDGVAGLLCPFHHHQLHAQHFISVYPPMGGTLCTMHVMQKLVCIDVTLPQSFVFYQPHVTHSLKMFIWWAYEFL